MKNLLIIGAGVAGRDVLKEIKNSPDLAYRPVGFIDDDGNKLGHKILGIKVLGSSRVLKKLIKEKNIDEVIIAIPSAEGERISDFVKTCSNAKIPFRIVPRVKEIIEGKANISSLRKVKVEDLLGRPVVKSDIGILKAFLKGKKIMVTGAAGSIGSELSRQIIAYEPKAVIFFDWWENGLFYLEQDVNMKTSSVKKIYVVGDIKDKQKVRNVLTSYKPDFIFHAAAYKHVPLMEDCPEEAIKNNVFGTKLLIKEAVRSGVKKFVFVSTDKAADPVNVMGASKLIAETIVKNQKNKTKFITVRFGNVLDSFGSVLPLFKKQIQMGGPVTITDPRMTRYFMTISEAAQLILKAANLGSGGELFVLDMGKPVRILDLAENLIRLSGHIPGKDIKIVYTGKRKGEKIREVLLNQEERKEIIRTSEEKIFISRSMGIEAEKLEVNLSGLERAALKNDKNDVLKYIKKMIPSFSKN